MKKKKWFGLLGKDEKASGVGEEGEVIVEEQKNPGVDRRRKKKDQRCQHEGKRKRKYND